MCSTGGMNPREHVSDGSAADGIGHGDARGGRGRIVRNCASSGGEVVGRSLIPGHRLHARSQKLALSSEGRALVDGVHGWRRAVMLRRSGGVSNANRLPVAVVGIEVTPVIACGLEARKLEGHAEVLEDPRGDRPALDDGDDSTGTAAGTTEDLLGEHPSEQRGPVNPATPLDDRRGLRRGRDDERAPLRLA